MSQSLTGSIALVTGATSGIGEATAKELAARGAHVLVAGRDGTRGEAVVRSIRASGGTGDFIAATLDGADSARDLADRATKIAGPIDILINNAGSGYLAPAVQTPDEAFHRIIGLNVEVPFYLFAALAPAMITAGKGAVVNVSSISGKFGIPGMSLYGASKAALNLLTKAWAVETGDSGVRVNGVSAGVVDTPGNAPVPEVMAGLAAAAPANRQAEPSEVAKAIAYLVSDDSSFVHGTTLDVDGGRNAV